MPPGKGVSFVHWYRNVFSQVPSIKVREIAAMLKAIPAGGLAATMSSRRLFKLSKSCAACARDCRKRGQTDASLLRFPRRSIGAGSGPITHWNASCARSGGAPVSSVHSRTDDPRSTLPNVI